MASNEPVGDGHRIGAVKKRTQLKGKLMGKTAWTKRDKTDGKFMALKNEPNPRKHRNRRSAPRSASRSFFQIALEHRSPR